MANQLRLVGRAFFQGAGSAAISLQGPVDLNNIQSDYNAFYQSPDYPVVMWKDRPHGLPEHLTLSEWQALGKDLHSQIFDPADPIVAAHIAEYQEELTTAVPPYITDPCCARFLFCVGSPAGQEPCTRPDMAIFIQHLPSSFGPIGWSDEIYYEEIGVQAFVRTYCGKCNRDGFLAVFP